MDYDNFYRKSDFIELEVKKLKKEDSIILERQPCKVISLIKKQSEKEGKPKLIVSGEGYFNGHKYMTVFDYEQDKIISPQLKRLNYLLVSLDRDNYVTLMDINGNIRSDLRLYEDSDREKEVVNQIKNVDLKRKDLLVSVLYVMGVERIYEYKIKNKI